MGSEQQRLSLIENLFQYYGLKEWTGQGKSNPEVEEFFKELGYNYSDDTAWCSAFANYIAKRHNLPYSGKLDARSWMDIGCPTQSPQVGDIVVFWRESRKSWKGHVAFFMSQDDEYVYALGGNQSNMINISAYPKYRVLGFRNLI